MAVGEWDQRQLCPDGGCVGVIGPDGTCKVCGRAAQNWGDERKRGLIDPPDDDDALAADDDHDAADDDALAADDDHDADDADDADDDRAVSASASFGDWGSRQLCPDGNCVGLIGPGGRCKVCGRVASSTAPAAAHGAASATATNAEPPSGKAVSGTTAGLSGDRGNRGNRTYGAAEGPDGDALEACSDSLCHGMVGADGHCDVCGKVVT